MKIAENMVVSFHYKLTTVDGEEIENTKIGEPLTFVTGKNEILFGLEKGLLGHTKNDKFVIEVFPEDAYGEYNLNLVDRVDKSRFDLSGGLEVGMRFKIENSDGDTSYKILEITDDYVVIDGNHIYAGETLYFDVEIVDVKLMAN